MIYIKVINRQDLTKEIAFPTPYAQQFFEYDSSILTTPPRQLEFTYTKDDDLTAYGISVKLNIHVPANDRGDEARLSKPMQNFLNNHGIVPGDIIVFVKGQSLTKIDFYCVRSTNPSYDTYKDILDTTDKPRDSHTHKIVTALKDVDTEAIRPNQIEATISNSDFNYIAAIKAKPFLILGGFSGTGKSQKVKELAFATCPCDGLLNTSETSPGNYLLVSVKPNWHDSTDLFGFESSVNGNYFVTDFMRFLIKAKMYEADNVPFFVCIDEMNLAPVEEYFAEFLSVIESRKLTSSGRIMTAPLVSNEVFLKKYENAEFNIFMSLGMKITNEAWTPGDINALSGDEQDAAFERQDIVNWLKAEGMTIPQNVVVVGTVNMDDSTNSFSRKVIDRAMTFEMLVEIITDEFFDAPKKLGYVEKPLKGDMFISDIVRADEVGELSDGSPWITADDREQLKEFINGINEDMEGSPFKVSYRVLNETVLLYRAKRHLHDNYKEFEELDADEFVELNNVFDAILMQKVLPRIEGDYDKCHGLLENLKERAERNRWVQSEAKMEEMIARFGNDQSGFTTFWN